MANLESLQKQRAAVKGNITRIKKLISSVMSTAELECRLSLVEAYFKQLLSIQTEIEIENPLDSARADVEDLCIKTKSIIIERLGDNYKRSNLESSIAIPFAASSKLPSLKLPSFDGKYSAYKNFISSFTQLVDNDASLSAIEKFNHLLHCLSGQALDTVSAFQVTSDNYKKALKRLEQRYDNTTLIFLEHITNLYDLPEVPKPEANHLHSLVDSASAIYSSLKSLGNDEQICHAMLIHMISKKLDMETQIKWKESLDFEKIPSWQDFCQSLERRCQFLESSESINLPTHSNHNRRPTHRQQNCRLSLHTQHKVCALCKCVDHWISGCSRLKSMPHEARFSTIKKLGLCINCLSEGHMVSRCSSKKTCKVCNKSHHTMLHRPTSDPYVDANSRTEPQETAAVHAHSDQSSNQVILATAVILISDGSGRLKLCRALLDSCSQVNLITESFARLLNLPKSNKSVNLIGVGGSASKIKYETSTTVRSRYNEKQFDLSFLISKRISGYQPDADVDIKEWKLPTNMELADEQFYQSQSIDLLLGADNFFEILRNGRVKLGSNLPTLQETEFGWVVSGRYNIRAGHKGNYRSSFACSQEAQDENLNQQLERFWSLEQIESFPPKWSKEHQACEELFVSQVKSLENGRIQVMLPFKNSPQLLGSSYSTALRRFTLLEKRLARDIDLKTQYIDFMREYEKLGHMTRIESVNSNESHYFIPHHCVIRPNSTSTKLRVVFDASAKTSSQMSLNDILYTGPTIQDELFQLVLRFRLKLYALTADIVKMYRMVLVHPSHRRFQMILWRENEGDPIQIFELNTITYGMSASPFLAIRCLHYIADRYKDEYPIGSEGIKRQFYVDDLLSGADDYESLTIIQQEVTEVLRKGGFELAKIKSNNSAFKSKTNKNINLIEPAITSALGVIWNPIEDSILFSFDPKKHYSEITKRSILSLTSSIFDPIGLLCPILIQPRVLLQDLWLQKIDWDIKVPQKTADLFHHFLEDLKNLQLFHIPRYVLCCRPASVQLHGFSDASLRAYGCCLYARIIDQNGYISVQLLTAKGRVAPTKKRTLPQLELCGAHLLSKLYSKVHHEFSKYDCTTFLWTDSSVVLHWIRMHSSTLNTFVGNRISEIQELTLNCNWRHVPTTLNPADLVSRGSSVSSLVDSNWFTGPTFLQHNMDCWPPTNLNNGTQLDVQAAVRKTVLQCKVEQNNIVTNK